MLGANAERTMAIDGTESVLMVLFCQLRNCSLETLVGRCVSRLRLKQEHNEFSNAFLVTELVHKLVIVV